MSSPRTTPTESCGLLLKYIEFSVKATLHWLTTITPPISNYKDSEPIQIVKNLEQATFLRTWYLEKDGGRATTTPPALVDKMRYVYNGQIPTGEIDKHFLLRNVKISSQGALSSDTIKLASCLDLPHQVGAAHENDFKNRKLYLDHINHLARDRKRRRKE